LPKISKGGVNTPRMKRGKNPRRGERYRNLKPISALSLLRIRKQKKYV
jgi:hypothetical protein